MVFIPNINIAKDIVSDVPDEISDPVYLRLIQGVNLPKIDITALVSFFTPI